MTSSLRSETSRRNGAKSNGPKTRSGKRLVSLNALANGLTAKTTLLTTENRPRCQARAASVRAELDPHAEAAALLVEEIGHDTWNLRRLWGGETSLLDSR